MCSLLSFISCTAISVGRLLNNVFWTLFAQHKYIYFAYELWVGDLLKLSDLKARKSVLNGTVLKRRLDLEKTSVLLPSRGSDGNNILTADSFIHLLIEK